MWLIELKTFRFISRPRPISLPPRSPHVGMTMGLGLGLGWTMGAPSNDPFWGEKNMYKANQFLGVGSKCFTNHTKIDKINTK